MASPKCITIGWLFLVSLSLCSANRHLLEVKEDKKAKDIKSPSSSGHVTTMGCLDCSEPEPVPPPCSPPTDIQPPNFPPPCIPGISCPPGGDLIMPPFFPPPDQFAPPPEPPTCGSCPCGAPVTQPPPYSPPIYFFPPPAPPLEPPPCGGSCLGMPVPPAPEPDCGCPIPSPPPPLTCDPRLGGCIESMDATAKEATGAHEDHKDTMEHVVPRRPSTDDEMLQHN
ncbi:leucine-rich repeat extensin-like protein 3 [Cornus florida]|uniref:leucine-rich repeat extensin-like protein 3 n=1 Tax=Cornus florida TaxID=4283 RepID=UPI00289E12BE|nr:leucine-rich repeat extensin-like protein 3 [Cornus florida]